jgi:hypothetical protein
LDAAGIVNEAIHNSIRGNGSLPGATVVYSIVMGTDSNVHASMPYSIFKVESK